MRSFIVQENKLDDLQEIFRYLNALRKILAILDHCPLHFYDFSTTICILGVLLAE